MHIQLTFGTGQIETSKASSPDGKSKWLLLKRHPVPREVGATVDLPDEETRGDDATRYDVALHFLNIESARVLQDTLNEMIAKWARQLAPKIPELKPE